MNDKKLKELFIKLKYIFPKDMILVKNRYAIAGEKSYDETYGLNITILEPAQEALVTEFFGKDVFVKDMTKLKEYAEGKHTEIVWEELSKDSSEKTHKMIESILKEVDGIDDWKSFVENEDFLKYIFDKKGIYNIPIPGTEDMIRIGKPALPMITVKNAPGYKYHVAYDEKYGIYRLFIRLDFTHFQLYMKYGVISMKRCEND